MTTFYSSVGHHRRTSSLPVFDDPPTFSRAGGGLRGGHVDRKESLLLRANPPASPRTPLTPRTNGGDDYWSKRGLTTARSGEIIDSGTPRHNTSTDNHFFTPLKGSTLHPSWAATPKVTPLGSTTSGSTTQTYHWSGTTSKTQGPKQPRSSSTFRSLNAGKVGGVADLDDGGLSGWADSFQKFILGATPSENTSATNNWKKEEFQYMEPEPISRSRSGSGTFERAQRNTPTIARGDRGVSRNVGSQRGYVSDSEDSWNWLETQREKLASKRAVQNLSHQRLNVEDRMNRQSSEVEERLLTELRASQSSLRGRTSESDLRYRARSMDNVGVNTDDYDVSYSKFGPSFQRRESPLRGWGSGTADGGSLRGPEERRAYQTLPKGTSLRRKASMERPTPGQTKYPSRTLRPGEERFNQSPDGAFPGGLSSSRRQLLGDNSKKRQDEEEEEITLRPIGPGVQPLESPTKVNPGQFIENYKASSNVPAIALTPATPVNASISTLPRFSTGIHSTKLNETLPVLNTGTGSPYVSRSPYASRDIRSKLGDDDIVVEQAIQPGVPLPAGTLLTNIQPDRPRQTSRDVYGNHGPSRSAALEAAQPKPLPGSHYASPPRQGQPEQQQQPRQQQQQHNAMDQFENYAGKTNWQNRHTTMDGYSTQSDRIAPVVTKDFPVIVQDMKYQTIQHNRNSEDGPRWSENLANQLGPGQLNTIRGYNGVDQLPNGQNVQQQLQIQQQMKELERQQLQLLQQQQRLQQQLEQLGLNATAAQSHQLLYQQDGRQEQQLLGLQPLQMQELQFNGKHNIPFQQQFVQQRNVYEQHHVQPPQLQEQQLIRGNPVQQQPTQDVQQVVQTVSRDNRSQQFGLQKQPQQLEEQLYETPYSHQYVQPVVQPVVQPIIRHAPLPKNQAFQPQKDITSFSPNNHSFTSPFPPHGVPTSSRGSLPLQLSSSQTQRDFPSNSPASGSQSRSNAIERQESEPVSPTGVTPHSQGCTMEIVQPTFGESTTNTIHTSSMTPSGPRLGAQVNYPVYATVNKSFASADLCSNGPLTLGSDTASRNQGYLVQHDARTNPAASTRGSFGSSSFVGAQNLTNQPRAIQTSPLDGTRVCGGISPETYWIQQAKADRNNISMVSSVGSSSNSSNNSHLAPLTVDVYRNQRWTDATAQGGYSSPSFYADRSSGGSLASSRDGPVDPPFPPSANFVKDISHLWYKPHLFRDEVINTLKTSPVGSFLVRDSNTYPGSFALAVRVAAVPTNAPIQKYPEGGDGLEELVRHFLIEPTPTGVRLKGYKNESVFGSLAALIYQHSITALSLPCRLRLPTSDANPKEVSRADDRPASSYEQPVYCAFNVLYLKTIAIELLTGPVALERAATLALEESSSLKTTIVNLKISSTGVTLTDNNRSVFFRRHFPSELIRYCGLDRRLRSWTYQNESTAQIAKHKIFGIVSRRSGLSVENECHLFAELDSNQSTSSSTSSTIISYVNQIINERDRK